MPKKLVGYEAGFTKTITDGDTVDVDGSINLGDDTGDDITIGGEIKSNIVPDANNTYDFGSSTKKWRNGYFENINQKDIKIARYNSDSTNTRFIRWVTTGVNNNTEASGSSCFVVPTNGTLDKVSIRTKSISNSTRIGFHRVGNNVGIPISESNFTQIQHVDVNVNASNTTFDVDFSSATFNSGDVIGISVNPTNSTDDVLMTIVLTFDWTS